MASLGLPARTNTSSASLNLPASLQARWTINRGRIESALLLPIGKQSDTLLFHSPCMHMGVCWSWQCSSGGDRDGDGGKSRFGGARDGDGESRFGGDSVMVRVGLVMTDMVMLVVNVGLVVMVMVRVGLVVIERVMVVRVGLHGSHNDDNGVD